MVGQVSRFKKKKTSKGREWHFALAVTTGKPALAYITASKPCATCLFLFAERRATFQEKNNDPPPLFYISSSHSCKWLLGRKK